MKKEDIGVRRGRKRPMKKRMRRGGKGDRCEKTAVNKEDKCVTRGGKAW